MKILAISDLHLASEVNREGFAALPSFPGHWLILAGDIAERMGHLRAAFIEATRRFEKVLWVPGNHELWAIPESGSRARPLAGEARYRALVEMAREHGIVTPEDPYPLWTGAGGPTIVAPLFLLYDYSFRPPHVAREQVAAWARERNSMCADELFLDPHPWESREAWCLERCRLTERRLAALDPALPTVLINHFPLRRDLIHIPRAPRFTPWCGTQETEDWHLRFNASVVVSGHLHVRRTDWRDGTRFEEVSLGHPRQWERGRGVAPYLREILPGPSAPAASQSPNR